VAALEKQVTVPNLPDASALLVIGVAARVEDHAVTGTQRRLHLDLDGVVADALDRADERSAFLSEPRVDKLLTPCIQPVFRPRENVISSL
jgi:hypothetical protein